MSEAVLERVAAAPAGRSSLDSWVQEKLEPGRWVYLAAITLLYFAAACVTARAKLVWYDEFFTLHLARLRSPGDIWQALAIGTTNDAPLNYLLTGLSLRLFGGGHVAFRLPAIGGVWVMCLCLYAYARRRWGTVWGFVGLLLPLSTGVWYYVSEGRPYGVMLGCAGGAFLCWTEAAAGRRRWLTLPGLGLSLAAAISTHYISVLLWAPLAMGELVRCRRNRRADWPVWITTAAGLLPLASFAPLIRASFSYSQHIWQGASLQTALNTYGVLLDPVWLPLLFALTAAVARPMAREKARRVEGGGLPAHEAAAAVCLAALPVCGFVLGKLVTGTYVERYGLGAIIGITVLFIAAVGGRSELGALLAVVFFVWFEFNALHSARNAGSHPEAAFQELDMSLFGDRLPVVASNADLFLKLEEYGPAAMKARLFSLHDEAAAIRILGNDTGERNMGGLAKITTLPITEYAPFIRAHREFLVYGFFVNRFDWLIEQLRSDGARVEYVRRVGEGWLFRVSF